MANMMRPDNQQAGQTGHPLKGDVRVRPGTDMLDRPGHVRSCPTCPKCPGGKALSRQAHRRIDVKVDQSSL